METYVVLFRAINVAGKNLLPMKELAATLEENGFIDVKTYIQSGNVVLKSHGSPIEKIAKIISKKFGFAPEVLLLSKEEFLRSVRHNPYHPKEGKSAHFYFCSAKPSINNDKLEKYLDASEEYKIINNVFYLHAPNGIGRSKLVANLESCLGVSVTGRNLNTINKLAEMVEAL